MSLETMKCPSCGAPITFEKDRDFVFCSHCGAQVFKNDENKKEITYRTVDEAKIKEIEYRAQKEKNSTKTFIIYAVFMILLLLFVEFFA